MATTGTDASLNNGADVDGYDSIDDLPDPETVDVEPQPPACEKDTVYVGYKGRYAFHYCNCCDRLYAIAAFSNVTQNTTEDGRLVIRDTKTHQRAECRGGVSVRQ